MATRFDRVTTPAHRPTKQASSLGGIDERLRARAPIAAASDLRATERFTADGRVLPVRPLAAAMSGWLAVVFASCYVAAPLAVGVTGLTGEVPAYAFAAVPAFLFAAFATVIGVLAARPAILLERGPRADPILAAVIGSLAVWVVTQNTMSTVLPSFGALTGAQLAALAATNTLEAALLGVMFASFTRSARVAFALGAGFKLLVTGAALAILGLISL